MAENLNFETDSSWCYDNDPANCDIYGRLYANNMALKSCPDGWHLSNNDEWCTLATFLDETVNCEDWGGLGTDAGGKMKATGIIGINGLWAPPNAGATNESGFTGIPGGGRHYGGSGSFGDKDHSAIFWSATEHGPDWYFYWKLKAGDALIYRLEELYRFGFSVRCVKDE